MSYFHMRRARGRWGNAPEISTKLLVNSWPLSRMPWLDSFMHADPGTRMVIEWEGYSGGNSPRSTFLLCCVQKSIPATCTIKKFGKAVIVAANSSPFSTNI